MKYVIDTSILIEIENGNEEIINALHQLKKTPFSELYITIFTFCEYYYGVMERSQENKEKVKQRLLQYEILNTSVESASHFCELFSALKKKGKSLPQFDTFIAAITIEQQGVLVTGDSDFAQIPNLNSIVLPV